MIGRENGATVGSELRIALGAQTGEAFQQSGFGVGQQIGDGGGIEAQRLGQMHGCAQVDAGHDTIRSETKLPGTAQQNVPGLPAGLGQGLVLAIGAAAATEETAFTAPSAVSGPAAEVPCGAGPDAFPSAARSSRGLR